MKQGGNYFFPEGTLIRQGYNIAKSELTRGGPVAAVGKASRITPVTGELTGETIAAGSAGDRKSVV